MQLSVQAKVGIVISLAIIVFCGMIIWKGDILVKPGGTYVVGSFRDVGGLIIGAEVRYRGYNVGKVTKVHPNPHDIKVMLRLNPGINVPRGSTLRVAFDGLIGQYHQICRIEEILQIIVCNKPFHQ